MKVEKLYITNEYLNINPSIHIEETPWKVRKIKPLIDKCLKKYNKRKLKLLDVGGGAGQILKEISSYIESKYNIKVEKYAIDLTPKILEIQKKNNPSLKKALNEDIKNTSLKDEEVDITLMIDVLEHVPNPCEALRELRRISKYVIFKVPLEKNFSLSVMNFLTFGRVRKRIIKRIGHVNIYSLKTLKNQLKENGFFIISSSYTNSFEYWVNSNRHKNKIKGLFFRIYYWAGYLTSMFFPNLAPLLLGDFAMVLVESKTTK